MRPEKCPVCAARLDLQHVEYNVLPDPQYNPRTHFLLCSNQECAWWVPCTRRGEVVEIISEVQKRRIDAVVVDCINHHLSELGPQ